MHSMLRFVQKVHDGLLASHFVFRKRPVTFSARGHIEESPVTGKAIITIASGDFPDELERTCLTLSVRHKSAVSLLSIPHAVGKDQLASYSQPSRPCDEGIHSAGTSTWLEEWSPSPR
jgi:hypothetical protein